MGFKGGGGGELDPSHFPLVHMPFIIGEEIIPLKKRLDIWINRSLSLLNQFDLIFIKCNTNFQLFFRVSQAIKVRYLSPNFPRIISNKIKFENILYQVGDIFSGLILRICHVLARFKKYKIFWYENVRKYV